MVSSGAVHHRGPANMAACGTTPPGEPKEPNNTGCLWGRDIGGLEQTWEGDFLKYSLCVFNLE